ncbi:cation:proton antiporter [Arcobacter sp. YIC-310]|uniref:cation:proton antiporter domain-containing protein n=1 Tax=Arcobacter sp. YIC-310 TaxID=3376632 RepID=UPI003C2A969D
MESILFILFLSLAISSILNIILKKFEISHIIGYIATGIIISSIFNLTKNHNLDALNLIAEFGIVFLMFTIGLEMSINRLKQIKELLFVNGFFQVAGSALLIFIISKFLFNIETISAVIISLAFSLSSTAIVLTYLKQSKDIYTPYGEKTTAILIFQDLAVIPILLLISFLSNDTLAINEIIIKTTFAAIVIITFMFTIGKKIVNWLLQFSTKARLEELFIGSVLSIVFGASILAHELGFTYSLGAFIAGMIIAETKYHIKVESDIASYKDLLLGTFFFTVGTKIDLIYLFENIIYIILIFLGILLLKAIVIYFLIKRKSNKNDSVKAALALCQIGEFSFAVFALASANNLLDENLSKFLILVTVLSMIITPFIVNNIYKIASVFAQEYFESDKITPINEKNHTIVCGYSNLGKRVASKLKANNIPFVIISDNLRHVLNARKSGHKAYFGHLEKVQVLESLKADEASSIIITLDNVNKKRLICDSILKYRPDINIVLKINNFHEKKEFEDLNIVNFVHAHNKIASLLVKKSL